LSLQILKVPAKVADNSSSGPKLATPLPEHMDCDQVRISFSVETECCVLRLEGAAGVPCADNLRETAIELLACQKDVVLDWSGATQIDASIAQVLLSLRAGLAGRNQSLRANGEIPPAIQNWLRSAGLFELLGLAEQNS
jgi:hypothetical protein